jgi:hypothetical protein
MIEPSIFILVSEDEKEEITVEELSTTMHTVLSEITAALTITIGSQQRTAQEWQEDQNWADAVIEQRSSIEAKPQGKKWGKMQPKEFAKRLYAKEVSVEKLFTSTGIGVKQVSNFFYRLSTATVIEGTLYTGARVSTKIGDFCSDKLSGLKRKAVKAT